ncbi:Cytochrome b [Andreprevotia lacus DSM 23236]|jgi:cytochrome b|uniref:Cytochrome b n=1 Tax=Andreprevotia lacus DSM 23236 TaxID=1121001 RepID=A0A1W1XAU5_9NEIS|nr:cytochrome b/b6 domain-containing protein [Andreprevotia lacus]SMC20980.1 Cytochrome b [Andreprevotia lacus DSM 23236]
MSTTTLRVWDPLVRSSHWLLALLVFNNFLNEEGHRLHRYSGYAAIALIVLRVLWGFVGTRHARFSDWFPTPARLLAYLRALRAGNAPRHLGHNPAGAVMMLALWLLVLALVCTGWLLTTDAWYGTEWLQDLHGGIAYTLLGAVAIHVGAAVLASRKHGENLIASMVHGRKRADN